MNAPSLPVWFLGITLAGNVTASLQAEALNLQVDSALSSITLSGTVEISGFSLALVEQGPQSLVATYAGTIPVEVTSGNLQFLPGAAIRALEPNSWKPGLGGASGDAKASYAAKATLFTANAFAASRNLVLDTTSAALPVTAGQFPAESITVKFLDTANSTLDFLSTGLINVKGTKILSGILTNRVASVGKLAGATGAETLTIPIDSNFGFSAASDSGTVVNFQLSFQGQIVATRGSAVEEPKVAFVPPATTGGPISLNWSKSYKLQRATSLSPVNWTDVLADSPITIPPIQPGEYFRVVKK